MLWNFKNIFPYTNIHDLNLDWIMRALKTLHEMVLERSVPAGGSTNQVLSKKSNADYDTEWKDIADNTRLWYPSVDEDGDLSWTKSDTEVAPQTVNIKGEQGPQGSQGIQGEQGPQGVQGLQGPAGAGVATGGSTGQILTKLSNSDYDTGWVNPGTASDPRFVADMWTTGPDGVTYFGDETSQLLRDEAVYGGVMMLAMSMGSVNRRNKFQPIPTVEYVTVDSAAHPFNAYDKTNNTIVTLASFYFNYNRTGKAAVVMNSDIGIETTDFAYVTFLGRIRR